MNRVTVTEPTGFKSETSPVFIFEEKRGLPFYVHKGNKSGGHFYFNLPKGNYLTENNLVKLKEPIPCYLPLLPKPEKKGKFPKKAKVEVVINPNKASILIGSHEIFVDEQIAKKPLPVIYYILFHEAGHYLYHDEEKCDTFAIRMMLKRGFNPAQCFQAINEALGDFPKSVKRKVCQFKNLFPNEKF